jgi:hypothetical protein
VVRANFTDDATWDRIREKIAASTEEGFGADVDFVEDRTLAGLDEATIVAGYPRAYPREYRHPVLFVSGPAQLGMIWPRISSRVSASWCTPGASTG